MPRILVVDDAEIDRKVIQAVLDQAPDMQIETACDGGEALEILSERPFDLVITDLIMPGMAGTELVAKVRDLQPLLPVLIVTFKGTEATAVDALHEGAASYVPKHLLTSRLLKTVDELLAISQAERSREQLLGCVEQTSARFVLENDPRLIESLVAHVVDLVRQLRVWNATQQMSLGVAMKEALKNALYHGNLQLGPEVCRQGNGQLVAAVAERSGISPYKDRRIRVAVALSHKEALFRVADEGPGFDVKAIRDSDDITRFEQFGGRGLVLMHTFMDEVTYNAAGNSVTLRKLRSARVPQPALPL